MLDHNCGQYFLPLLKERMMVKTPPAKNGEFGRKRGALELAKMLQGVSHPDGTTDAVCFEVWGRQPVLTPPNV